MLKKTRHLSLNSIAAFTKTKASSKDVIHKPTLFFLMKIRPYYKLTTLNATHSNAKYPDLG